MHLQARTLVFVLPLDLDLDWTSLFSGLGTQARIDLCYQLSKVPGLLTADLGLLSLHNRVHQFLGVNQSQSSSPRKFVPALESPDIRFDDSLRGLKGLFVVY